MSMKIIISSGREHGKSSGGIYLGSISIFVCAGEAFAEAGAGISAASTAWGLFAGIAIGIAASYLWRRGLRRWRTISSSICACGASIGAADCRCARDIKEIANTLMSETDGTFALMDSDLRIVDINHLADFPLGTTKEDLIGKHILTISPYLEHSGWIHRFRSVMETGKFLVADDVIPLPVGGTKHMTLTVMRMGNCIGVRAKPFGQDERLTSLLGWAKGRWESLVSYIPGVIAILNRDGTVEFATRTHMGGSADRIIGRGFGDFMTPEYRSLAMECLDKAITEQREVQFEAKVYGFDNKIYWMDIRIGPIQDESQRAAIIVALDITDKKTTEKELQESEGVYRAFLETGVCPILAADVETMKIEYANRAACATFGYTKEEFLKLSIWELHPKDKHEDVIASFQAHARKERTVTIGFPCIKKDGVRFVVDFRVAPTVLKGRQCNVAFLTDPREE